MDENECDFDTENFDELPKDSLMICPVCGHWVKAGRPHPKEFIGPSAINPWFDDPKE